MRLSQEVEISETTQRNWEGQNRLGGLRTRGFLKSTDLLSPTGSLPFSVWFNAAVCQARTVHNWFSTCVPCHRERKGLYSLPLRVSRCRPNLESLPFTLLYPTLICTSRNWIREMCASCVAPQTEAPSHQDNCTDRQLSCRLPSAEGCVAVCFPLGSDAKVRDKN